MLARMYTRRLKGYSLIGYKILGASNKMPFLQQAEHRFPEEPFVKGEI